MIPVEYVTAGGLVFVAIIGGIFSLIARRGGERRPAAVAYNEMWQRLDQQDNRIAEVELNLRVVGDGFDAFYNAMSREGSSLHLTEQEQIAVNRARRLRTGEDELVN